MEFRQCAVEGLGMTPEFWRGRRVFLTGHTGFKGSWLALWLHALGARVTGFALAPPTKPSLFELARVDQCLTDLRGDVRSLDAVVSAMNTCRPEIVIHMAAQALVRDSYADPAATYASNVMGTVNVLEAVRRAGGVRSVVVVTSDKCYENREWVWGYRENEPMGGHDPYSSSKGCAELVTDSYRRSFFGEETAVASARAGNVIGGGDWAHERLLPDMMRAALHGETVRLRNPDAVRPWQHVLEPLSGYLTLAERLCRDGQRYAEGWNFGPADEDARPVEWIARQTASLWPGMLWECDHGSHPHEAHYLKLDCSKARIGLGWQPRLALAEALAWTVRWYDAYGRGADVRAMTEEQIRQYSERVPA